MFKQCWMLCLILACTLTGLSENSHAFGQNRRDSTSVMGVLGDSISAGSVADIGLSPFYIFPFTKPAGRSEFSEFPEFSESSENSQFSQFSEFSELSTQQLEARLVAASLLNNKETLSWASGNYVNSHYRRLKAAMNQDKLKVINVAIPASKTKLLKFQADLLVDAVESGHYKELKYVTIMIGAVDSCSPETPVGTPNDEMAEDLFQVFKKISHIQQKNPIHILVEAVPRVPDLAKEEIRNTRLLGKWSCDLIQRKIFKFCNSLLVWETPQEYQEKVAIVDAKNRALESAVTRANAELKNLDIRFDNGFYNETIHVDELAADCFHPNIKGHERISEVLWSKQPWF